MLSGLPSGPEWPHSIKITSEQASGDGVVYTKVRKTARSLPLPE